MVKIILMTYNSYIFQIPEENSSSAYNHITGVNKTHLNSKTRLNLLI